MAAQLQVEHSEEQSHLLEEQHQRELAVRTLAPPSSVSSVSTHALFAEEYRRVQAKKKAQTQPAASFSEFGELERRHILSPKAEDVDVEGSV